MSIESRDLRRELDEWEDCWPSPWKPNVDEVLVGEILSYDRGFTPFGEVRTVIIRQESGEKVSLWLSSTVLLDLFRRYEPKVGEKIGLKYLGKDARKGYHRYRLVVDRDEANDFSPLGGEIDGT